MYNIKKCKICIKSGLRFFEKGYIVKMYLGLQSRCVTIQGYMSDNKDSILFILMPIYYRPRLLSGSVFCNDMVCNVNDTTNDFRYVMSVVSTFSDMSTFSSIAVVSDCVVFSCVVTASV